MVFISMKKIIFSDNQVQEIKKYYLIDKLSCNEIGKKFGVSKRPINRLLRQYNILRSGVSDGKKIIIDESEKEKIKFLYLIEKKTAKEICQILNYGKSFIDKHIQKSGYGRSKGESISLRQTGKKRSEHVKMILKKAQQNLAKSGNRKQAGGVCKKYIVEGIECLGTYEKFFIEKMIKEKKGLPKNAKSIPTPYGVYYPDFILNDKLIEIKSEYTYNVLLGNEVNRYTKKIDKSQYNKIKWVNENITPIEIIVVDKINNKLIKKSIN